MSPSAETLSNGTHGHESEYRVLDQYHSKPRKVKIICVGAGASGLCLASKIQHMLAPDTWDLTIYEKNTTVGGTWHENTYPGVACDIPAHIYSFTFDPKPDWSHYYAQGAEIQEYFEGFADRHGCRKYVTFETKVTAAAWDANEGVWRVAVRNLQTGEETTDTAHFVVNGSGILNNWKWPDVRDLDSFQGPRVHSAKWDHSVELAGKTVGVIGTGSTAIQIIPQLQKICKKVIVFMRSPTYVSAPFGTGALSGELAQDLNKNVANRQYTFTEEQKKKFKDDPAYHLSFRKTIEAEICALWQAYRKDGALNSGFKTVIVEEMIRRIGPGNERLKQFIVPDWAPGCRRISPGDGYLEALVQPNVECVFGEIERATSNGLVSTENGQHLEMDVLVCATGFQPGFKPAFPVTNGHGKTIEEDWVGGVNMYFGISAPRFPNFYTMVGPGATWSNGTLLPSIETSVEYALKMVRKMQTELIKSMEVKQEALDDIYAHFDEYHKTTVFQDNCRSWFKDGKINNRIYLWPGSTVHFIKTLRDPRMEDYNFEYMHGNRFAFLGNGDVKATESRSVDGLAPHIRNEDTEWFVE